jgi:hypothetical protein
VSVWPTRAVPLIVGREVLTGRRAGEGVAGGFAGGAGGGAGQGFDGGPDGGVEGGVSLVGAVPALRSISVWPTPQPSRRSARAAQVFFAGTALAGASSAVRTTRFPLWATETAVRRVVPSGRRSFVLLVRPKKTTAVLAAGSAEVDGAVSMLAPRTTRPAWEMTDCDCDSFRYASRPPVALILRENRHVKRMGSDGTSVRM